MHPLFQKADRVAEDVVDASKEVLKLLGQGLLESIYEACLTRELTLRGHTVETEKFVTYHYKGADFSTKLRADLLVDNCLVVELKSIEKRLSLEHQMQTLSYMRLLDYPLGLVINFGATSTRRIRRVILKGADKP